MTRSQIKNKRRKIKEKHRRNQRIRSILGVIIIIVLAFASSAVFKNHFTGILGFHGYITLSDSMDPVVQKGSLLITQRVSAGAIRPGDIITYHDGTEITTQRVADIINDNGAVSFITKGDANEGVNSQPVPAGKLIGRFVYAISFAGSLLLAIHSPATMALLIAGVCAIIIGADEINKRIKKRLRKKKRQRGRYPQNGGGPADERPNFTLSYEPFTWPRLYHRYKKTSKFCASICLPPRPIRLHSAKIYHIIVPI